MTEENSTQSSGPSANSVADDRRDELAWGTTAFVPGPDVGLVARGTIGLVEHDNPSTRERLWALVAVDAPLGDILDELSSTGLKALPDFGLAQVEGADLRIVARGRTRISAELASGSTHEVDASEVRTWIEQVVSDVESITISLPADGDADPDRFGPEAAFAVLAGSVPVSSLTRRYDQPDVHAATADDGWTAGRTGSDAEHDDRVDDDDPNVAGHDGHDDHDDSIDDDPIDDDPIDDDPIDDDPIDDDHEDPGAGGPSTETSTAAGVGIRDDGRPEHDDGDRSDTEDDAPSATGEEAPADGDAVTTDALPLHDPTAPAPPDARPSDPQPPAPVGPPVGTTRADVGVDEGWLSAGAVFLAFSNGERIDIERAVLIGRNPKTANEPTDGVPPRVVTFHGPGQGLSRTHAEVRIQNDELLVEDLRSTNGTDVQLPGEARRALLPNEPVAVVPGTLIDFGEELQCTVEYEG